MTNGIGQRHDKVSTEALAPKIAAQLVGDVPGEQQRVLRLILEQLRLVEHRDRVPGHVLAELVRTRDLEHAVEDPVVEPDVVDERARARRRADAVDPRAALLESPAAARSSSSFDCATRSRNTPIQLSSARPTSRSSVSSDRRRWPDRVLPAARRVDADRAAVRRDALGVERLEAVHLEQRAQAVERVVAQVLVVDRVVLQRLDQRRQVVRLRDEHAVVAEQRATLSTTAWTSSMCAKTLVAVDESRPAVLRARPRPPSGPKNAVSVAIPRSRASSPVSVGSMPSTRWPRLLEVREQRAVVRADVDDEIVGCERRAGRTPLVRARRSSREGRVSSPSCTGTPAGTGSPGSTMSPSCASWQRRADEQLRRIAGLARPAGGRAAACCSPAAGSRGRAPSRRSASRRPGSARSARAVKRPEASRRAPTATYHAYVRRRPSSSVTRGSEPEDASCAREMSGSRRRSPLRTARTAARSRVPITRARSAMRSLIGMLLARIADVEDPPAARRARAPTTVACNGIVDVAERTTLLAVALHRELLAASEPRDELRDDVIPAHRRAVHVVVAKDTYSNPCRRAALTTTSSPTILLPPYDQRGLVGSGTTSGSDSGVGKTLGSPYTSDDDENTSRRTPSVAHASAMFSTPRRLTSRTRSGDE